MSSLGAIAAILGVLGLLFILAGPAFHLLPGSNNLWIFTALVCWIVGGMIRGLVRKAEKKSSGFL